jgi:hypothetical protein
MDAHTSPYLALIAALAQSVLGQLVLSQSALAQSARAPSAFAAQTVQSAAQVDDRILIYRCTDARGRLALRDAPCRSGERQDIRTMVRPKDAPTRPSAGKRSQTPVSTAMHGASPLPQVIFLQHPRPVYECTAPDNVAGNRRYLSDTPEGRLRWVPRPVDTAVVFTPLYHPNHGFVQISDNSLQAGYQAGSWGPLLIDNGTWVRDTCYALPQADACERLREERGHLGRRRFNAQPTERAEINREERSVEARIAQDCP